MKVFRKILKWGGILVLVAVVGIGLLAAHTWYFKPLSINWFFGRAFLQFALESPEMLSSMRMLEPLGIDGHNAHLDDASIESGDRMYEQLREFRVILVSYDDEDLAEQDLLSKRVMLGMLDQFIETEPFRFHNYPVNQLFGEQNGFPTFMESTHQVALAYKIGMTKILELRELAQTELGDDFDIREFHDVILSDGGLPLTILEEIVREWIAEKKASAVT